MGTDRIALGSCGTLPTRNCPAWCSDTHDRYSWVHVHHIARVNGRTVLVQQTDNQVPTVTVMAPADQSDRFTLWGLTPQQAYALASLIGTTGDEALAGAVLAAVELIAPEVTA